MTSLTLSLALLASVVLAAAWHAHHLGNASRDVALLGATGGLLGVGALVAAVA